MSALLATPFATFHLWTHGSKAFAEFHALLGGEQYRGTRPGSLFLLLSAEALPRIAKQRCERGAAGDSRRPRNETGSSPSGSVP
jgi:hypothetical protein